MANYSNYDEYQMNGYDLIEEQDDISFHDSALFPVYRSVCVMPSSAEFGFGNFDISEIEQFNPYDDVKPGKVSRSNSLMYNEYSPVEINVQDEFDMVISRDGCSSYSSCLTQVKTIAEMQGSSKSVAMIVQSFLSKNEIHSQYDSKSLVWNCEVAVRFDVLKFQITLFSSSKNSQIVEFLRLNGSSKRFHQIYSAFRENNATIEELLYGNCPSSDFSCEKQIEELINWLEFEPEEAFKAIAEIAFSLTDRQAKVELLQKLSERLVSLNLSQESVLLANCLIKSNDECANTCLNILSPVIARSLVHLAGRPLIKSVGTSVMNHLVEAY